ncbi:MAG: endonuclease domain-containing protein [Anaerolineae bacterium]|nr:endonuclease domain-containing protein [Anaerolineae bacterium]
MVQVARELRQRETDAEVVLWEALRNRRLANLKFRRQHPIALTAFVADFLCYEHRLIVELDGGIHETKREEDALRQQAIEEAGYQVIRITNNQVLNHLEDVLITIVSICDSSPLALRERGRG